MQAREISYEILCDILLKNKFSTNLLEQKIEEKLNPNSLDRSLIYQIVYGTVKQKIFLEYVVNKFINPKKTEQKIQIILWLSVYQYWFLDRIPNYAIVNEAVNLTKKVNTRFSGFVNATLKKIFSSDTNIFIVNQNDQHDNLLIKYSFPKELSEIIKNQYGEEILIKIVEDNILIPKLSLRVNTLWISRDQLLDQYHSFGLKKSNLSPNGVISETPVINSEMFQKGFVFVQDEMSMHVAEVLAPLSTDYVLDMCSAPGGKTTYLSQLMNNIGQIDAYDISQTKINLVIQNLQRLGITNVTTHIGDSSKIISDQKYDRILCDVPCSGWGVMKRKPEIKYRSFNTLKMNSLIKIQQNLLKKGYELLKQGGILVYSTCTFNKVENEKQIETFLENHLDMVILDSQQVFGYENNTDGFYYCKMIKRT